MTERIHAVYGTEPMREGEYPTGMHVGYASYDGRVVADIKRETINLGDRGEVFFHALDENGHRIMSMSLRYVADIRYFAPDQQNPS